MFDSEVGPGLVAELAAADLAALDDAGRLDYTVAAARCESWLAALRLAGAAAFADTRPPDAVETAHGRAGLGPGGCSGFTGDELGLALSVSAWAAETMIDTGRLLRSSLSQTGALLAAGQIDGYKAHLVCEAARRLDEQQHAALDEQMAEKLAGKTPTQIRRALTRTVIRIDPTAAEVRRTRRLADRYVSTRPDQDGMTWLSALLAAETAEKISIRLNSLTRLQDPADPRTKMQQRTDIFTDLLLANPWPEEPPVADSSKSSDDLAGSPVGDGTDTDGTDAGENTGTDQTVTGSRSRRPATGRRAGTQVHVIVAASTLAGYDEEPATLAGYGTITAQHARDLAAGDATWRRILTDPASGTVLDVGTTTYRPPAAMDRHVKTRDRTCRFPGCQRSAWTTDTDHTKPFPLGPTSAANLASLCRHHHRLKHEAAGWHLDQPEPGVLIWTSPTGRTYTVTPDTS